MAEKTPVVTPKKCTVPSYDVHDMEEGENVTVHGHVIQLSPVKDSQK